MITTKNYLTETRSIDLSKSNKVIQQGHEFTVENIDLYGEDETIDKAIDNHIKLLNAFLQSSSQEGMNVSKKKAKDSRPARQRDIVRKVTEPIRIEKIEKKHFKGRAKAAVKKLISEAKAEKKQVGPSRYSDLFDNQILMFHQTPVRYSAISKSFFTSLGRPTGIKGLQKLTYPTLADQEKVNKTIEESMIESYWKSHPQYTGKAKAKRIVDIGYGGGMGSEIIVAWDRNKKENNDYKTIAHINSITGDVKFYDNSLPQEAIEELEKAAKKFSKKETSHPLVCPPIDADGKRRIDAEGLELLQECIKSEPSTKAANSKDGHYTKEREKLHEKLINQFKEHKPCIVREAPIAILTGGPPGSGKSHFLKKFAPWIASGNLYHIDADEVRAKLPEYKGWNADNSHAETKDIVNDLISDIGNPCEHDLIYDGTMNRADNYLPLIDRLHKMGYKVFVIYMQVPKKVSVERAMERYQRTGRYVPISVINEVFDKGLAGYEEVIKKADGYIRVDGQTSEILAKGGMQIPKERNYEMEPPCCDNCAEGKKCEAHEGKKGEPKPAFKKGDFVEVVKYHWAMKIDSIKGFNKEEGQWEYMLENMHSNDKIGNPGSYFENELYKLDFKEPTNKHEPAAAASHHEPAGHEPTGIEKDSEGHITIEPTAAKKRFTSAEKEAAVQAIRAQLDLLVNGPQNLSRRDVLSIAQDINQHHRSLWSQNYDNTRDARQRIEPNPENLIRWMKNPGKFDMIGVDNFHKDDPTAELKIKKEIFWHRLGMGKKK